LPPDWWGMLPQWQVRWCLIVTYQRGGAMRNFLLANFIQLYLGKAR
jgi:hypothetical protein